MPITLADIPRLVAEEEGAYLERKPPNVNREELRRTLVAFANSVEEGQEGVLLIGIGNRGELLGVPNTDEKQKLIDQICNEVCYPAIEYRVHVIPINGVNILAVTVPISRRRPHFAGAAFVRRGSSSVKATPELYEDLIASRVEKCRALLRWKDQVFSVLEDGYSLGNPAGRVIAGRALRECRLVACDPHTVRLRDIGSDEHFTVALNRVEIGYDELRHRNLLRVHP